MLHDFVPKLAKVLTEYSAPIKRGDFAVILGGIEAEPIMLGLTEAITKRGGNPVALPQLPMAGELFFQHAEDHQLEWVNPVMTLVMDKMDVLYNIMAPTNTKNLSNTDPLKLAKAQKAQQPIMETFMRRFSDESLLWTLFAWPTGSGAQEAEMGTLAYAEFIYNACALDQADPVAYWQGFRDKQMRYSEWLKGKKHAQVKGPGIDLEFDFSGRSWVSAHGTVNFPDGEIYTGPVEESVNGYVEFNERTVYQGREVSGIKLRYEKGKIVEASATKNEEWLMSQLDLDEGARRMGEFAIGTNFGIQKVTGNTLFDEKIGGTIHMAVGFSIPQTGGVNHSAVHWDMVHNMRDGGEILIDGQLFYKAGKFMID